MGINKQQIVDTLLAGKSVVSPDTPSVSPSRVVLRRRRDADHQVRPAGAKKLP